MRSRFDDFYEAFNKELEKGTVVTQEDHKMDDKIEYKFVTKLLKLHDKKEVYVLNIMKSTKYGAGFLRQHSYDHKPTPHDIAKAIEEYMLEDENEDEEEKGCPNR